MTLQEQLTRLKSQRVTLEFDDGEVIEAVLLDVDPTDHEDITFDVLEVRQTVRAIPYHRKNVYIAPIITVRRATALL